MSAEDSLAAAEELLARLEAARARLEQTDDPEQAIEVLQELAELAKQIEAELAAGAQPRRRPMPRTPEELREAVERYLDELPLHPALGTLAAPVRYALGGKRVRPVICLAAGEAAGGELDAARCRPRPRSSSSTPSRSSTTTCPRSTTTPSGAGGRASGPPTARRPRSSPATRCSPRRCGSRSRCGRRGRRASSPTRRSR